MKITQGKFTQAALMALMLTSGSVQAEQVISVTPRTAQPGQTITLQGQFSPDLYRSRQYRIKLFKLIAPRPPGTIDGFVDVTRATSTQLMIQLPRQWQGKPVYPGEYNVNIWDASGNRWVRTGVNPARVSIRAQQRSPLGAAKNSAMNNIRQNQNRQLGGNTAAAAAPHSAFGLGTAGALPRAGNTAQMKLMLRALTVNGRDAWYGRVSLGDTAIATFDVQNLGRAADEVKVGYLIGSRVYGLSNPIRVEPGRSASTNLRIRLNPPPQDMNIHSVRGADGLWWNPRFALRTSANQPYRDSYAADNSYYASTPIPISAANDLAVVAIERVKVTETWRAPIGQGTMRPVFVDLVVKVKNQGTTTSQPTRLTVALRGTRESSAPAIQGSSKAKYTRGIDCASGCLLTKSDTIAAIPAGETASFPIRFERIPFRLVQKGNKGPRAALSYYGCFDGLTSGGAAKISASLADAARNEAVPLRKDNYLSLSGSFGMRPSGDPASCGLEGGSTSRP